MDTRTVIKQVALSLFARRKKWIVLTTLAALVLLLPAAYVLSKEPPRYPDHRDDPDREQGGAGAGLPGVLAQPAPARPAGHPPEPAARRLGRSRRCRRPRVEDLIHNPYGRDYLGELMDWVAPAARQGAGRAQPPAARRRGAAPGSRQVHQPAGQLRHRRDLGGGLPAPDRARHRQHLHRGAPGPHPLLQRGRRQEHPGVPVPAERSRCRMRSSRSETALRAFTMSRGGVQIPAKSARDRPAPVPARDHASPRSRPTRTSARPA